VAVVMIRRGQMDDYPHYARTTYRTFVKLENPLGKYIEYIVLCFIFRVLFVADI
jgi:hypothetical protein